MSVKDANRCEYAMNPNCEPIRHPTRVLLFETMVGWNQFGGSELIAFDNHLFGGA